MYTEFFVPLNMTSEEKRLGNTIDQLRNRTQMVPNGKEE